MTKNDSGTIAHLEALVAGLAREQDIHVEIGDMASFNVKTRVLTVPKNLASNLGAVQCAAVVAHEVGHVMISRYHLFHQHDANLFFTPFVLNSIEDPRVNLWMSRRYPGTARWFAEFYTNACGEPSQRGLPPFLQLTWGFAAASRFGWRDLTFSAHFANQVVSALKETAEARSRYAETAPTAEITDIDNEDEIDRAYTEIPVEILESLEGAGEYRSDGADQRERAALVCAHRAYGIFQTEILPVASHIIEQDLRRLACFIALHPEVEHQLREKLSLLGATLANKVIREAFSDQLVLPQGPKPDARVISLARKAYEAFLNQDPIDLSSLFSRLVETAGGEVVSSEASAMSKELRRRAGQASKPQTSLDVVECSRAEAKAFKQTATLIKELEDLFVPRRRLGMRSGFPSGHEVSLRAAMAFDADPRRYLELWNRKTIPDRSEFVFSLLIDLSGSMKKGGKSEAALVGARLLADSLDHVGIRFAVNGFQDELIPFHRFGDPYTNASRYALRGIPKEISGCRAGGHNRPIFNDDGPCLKEAAEQLLNQQATTRILIVISDGNPEGIRSDESDLKRAVAELSRIDASPTLIAVGLGSDHVNKFYPNAIANVPAESLGSQIGHLIKRTLME